MSEAQNGACSWIQSLEAWIVHQTGGLGGTGVSMHIIADIQPIDGDQLLIRGLESRPIMAELKRWSIRVKKFDRTICSLKRIPYLEAIPKRVDLRQVLISNPVFDVNPPSQ